MLAASSLSAGSGRCAAGSVRKMLASTSASPGSLLARLTTYRSRYRDTASANKGRNLRHVPSKQTGRPGTPQ
jgi:hypothetical protein